MKKWNWSAPDNILYFPNLSNKINYVFDRKLTCSVHWTNKHKLYFYRILPNAAFVQLIYFWVKGAQLGKLCEMVTPIFQSHQTPSFPSGVSKAFFLRTVLALLESFHIYLVFQVTKTCGRCWFKAFWIPTNTYVGTIPFINKKDQVVVPWKPKAQKNINDKGNCMTWLPHCVLLTITQHSGINHSTDRIEYYSSVWYQAKMTQCGNK